MQRTAFVTIVSIVLIQLFSTADGITTGAKGPAPNRRGTFPGAHDYPAPPPPPPPKIHYGPKPPPTQVFVNKLAPDEHIIHPNIRPHLHHRGPPNIQSGIQLHHPGHGGHFSPDTILSHSILSPASPPIVIKAQPPRVGHGPPLPIQSHQPPNQLQGPPHLHIHGPIHNGPPQLHLPGPFGPPMTLHHHPHHDQPPTHVVLQFRPPPPIVHHTPPTPPASPPPPPPPPLPPTPPPKPSFAHWKTSPPSFRAPILKETFHASPSSVYQSPAQFIRDDDDKGPIHTIPAPNLSRDKPHPHRQIISKPHPPPLHLSHVQPRPLPQPIKPVHSDHTPVESYSINGYRVSEDQTVHKPGIGPSYFAPDPDPSVLGPKVPITNDPFSMPSNGQAPLDLIIQEHNDKQNQQLEHLSSTLEPGNNNGVGNTLTAQDLFNIFNTINQQQLHVIPPAGSSSETNFDDHNQDDPYSSYLLQQQQQQHRQQQPQDFHPQFQTFNYEEQTQQNAHGSDSYPVGTSNIEFKRAVGQSLNQRLRYRMKPEGVVTSSRNNMVVTHQNKFNNNFNNVKPYKYSSVTKSSEINTIQKDLINNHVDNSYDDSEEEDNSNSKEESEQTSPENLSPEDVTLRSIRPLMYSTLPSKQVADTFADLAAAGLSKTTSVTVRSITNRQTTPYSRDVSKTSQEYDDEDVGEDDNGTEEDNSNEDVNSSEKTFNGNKVITGKYQSVPNHSTDNGKNENVQLQKSIQIYETSYFDKGIPSTVSGTSSHEPMINDNKKTTDKYYDSESDDDYKQDGDDHIDSDPDENDSQKRPTKREDNASESSSDSIESSSSSLSFGSRIRPKRN